LTERGVDADNSAAVIDDMIEVVGRVAVDRVVEGSAFSEDATDVDDVFANLAKLRNLVRMNIYALGELYLLQLLVVLRHWACYY
jgi:stalled ribosome rescue protein Dom34